MSCDTSSQQRATPPPFEQASVFQRSFVVQTLLRQLLEEAKNSPEARSEVKEIKSLICTCT